MQNQDLTELGVKIAKHLASDTEIRDYCVEHFDKDLSLFVGPPDDQVPSEQQCPYIFLHDLTKTEGLDLTTASYSVVLGVGVYTEDAVALCSDIIEVNAGQQYCSELMTLVQKSLYQYKTKTSCLPPSSVESYLPLPPYASKFHWEGFIAVTWDVELYMGADIKF